jgi:hypothetical protein
MYFSNYVLLNFPAQNLIFRLRALIAILLFIGILANATGEGWDSKTPAGYTPPTSFGKMPLI